MKQHAETINPNNSTNHYLSDETEVIVILSTN